MKPVMFIHTSGKHSRSAGKTTSAVSKPIIYSSFYTMHVLTSKCVFIQLVRASCMVVQVSRSLEDGVQLWREGQIAKINSEDDQRFEGLRQSWSPWGSAHASARTETLPSEGSF